MAIATVDDIVAALAAASRQTYGFYKVLAAPKAAGSWVSGWMATGNPAAGAAPPAYTAGSGYTCDKTTVGSLANFTNGATQLWLPRIGCGASQTGTLVLYDRLWSCGGMGFTAATYTVTTPGNLPARITDSGVGVEAFVEQFVTAGAASGTLTMNYKNVAAASKSGVIAAVVSAPVASQLQIIPLAAGDTGVSQVVSAVNSATWTSGSFGITLMKRICEISVVLANGGMILDWASIPLSKIPNDACLQFAMLDASATQANLFGSLTLVDK